MCEALDYHLYAIYQLRLLRVLDGSGISSASKAAAKAKYAGRLTLEFLEDKAGLTSWSQCAAPCSCMPASLRYASKTHLVYHMLFVCLGEQGRLRL